MATKPYSWSVIAFWEGRRRKRCRETLLIMSDADTAERSMLVICTTESATHVIQRGQLPKIGP